ncbi:WSSV387 [White spot syndrome virus]|uniref:WSSV387 n=1 Tax=White spot syndrome virus TaxID=342409 RepID=A0A2I6SC77_9VIRU|nr:WSSV387 [White spot syndrome virus]
MLVTGGVVEGVEGGGGLVEEAEAACCCCCCFTLFENSSI